MTKKLWGGGYRQRTSQTIERYTASVAIDHRLAVEDLEGSIAHAKMLGRQRIIPPTEAARIIKGLESLKKDWEAGKVGFHPLAEDIHSVLHAALERKIGAAAQYLHTARSRNDQVITDTRLFSVRAARRIAGAIRALQSSIIQAASKHRMLVVPGYTHRQHAQPVLWAHWLLSYCEALERDHQRLMAAAERLNELPLGSGALTGTSLPIDRLVVAKTLGMSRVAANSMDAVSDRDGVLELLAVLTILGIHLSRIAEDLMYWVSPEVGFLALEEWLCTGSSMMPQKQNPDFLELTRANAGKLIGVLTGFLAVCKSLPSGYNRDLQVDKEHLLAAVDTTSQMLDVLIEGFHGLIIRPDAIQQALRNEALYATDLAEYLVEKGVPFAQAHHAVGELMGYCRQHQQQPSELTVATLRRFSPHFGSDVHRLFDPQVSVSRKQSLGSTNPRLVARQLAHWQRRVSRHA